MLLTRRISQFLVLASLLVAVALVASRPAAAQTPDMVLADFDTSLLPKPRATGSVTLRASAEGHVVNRFPVVGSAIVVHGDLPTDVASCTGKLHQWVEGHQSTFTNSTVAVASYSLPGSSFQQTQIQRKIVIYAMEASDGSQDRATCTLAGGGSSENRKVERLRVEWVESRTEQPIIDWRETVRGWPGGLLGATLGFPLVLGLFVGGTTKSLPITAVAFLAAFGFLSAVMGLSMLALVIVITVAIGFGMTATILSRGG